MRLPRDITYGELFDAADKVELLKWMRAEKEAVPQSDKALNELVCRWIRYQRKQLLARLAANRKRTL